MQNTDNLKILKQLGIDSASVMRIMDRHTSAVFAGGKDSLKRSSPA
jgi:hypothetical protein